MELSTQGISVSSLILSLFLWAGPAQGMPTRPTAILVDKATHTLKVTELVGGKYKILKSYPATVGQVRGDKIDEDDLKTPEGIYKVTQRLVPPSIKPKFGVMAFYMDYPNPYDRMAGRTGYDIMLHATNDPARLKKELDSKGCIVVNNEQIEEIRPFVRVGLTPIIVFDKLTPEYLAPGQDTRLTQFFERWKSAWTGKDLETYIGSYHSSFKAKGMDLKGWRRYKAGLNKKYDEIRVGAKDVLFYRHPKYNVVTFTQDYVSTFPGGSTAYRASGTKILYIAEERGALKVIAEDYTRLTW